MEASDQYISMSIASPGPSTLPDQKRMPVHHHIRDINSVEDIDGAVSSVPYGNRYTDKPQPSQDDVAGSRSRPLTRERNVRDLNLFVDDIDGTRHAIRDRMMKTSRHVDPLNPKYQLPSAMPVDPLIPKFIRDNMNVDDIDGAKAKPPKKLQVRDNMSTADIIGAQACWKPAHKQARAQSAPHDIMQGPEEKELRPRRFQDRSSRCTNPVSPEYLVDGMKIKDDEKYSKPKPLKKFIAGNHQLRTDDIDGAREGFGRIQGEVRNLMNVDDIDGAQPDTVKSAIQTKRTTDPLTPLYTSLDGEPMEPLLRPLIPPSFVKRPTLRVHDGKKEIPCTDKGDIASSTVYSARSFAEAYNDADANADSQDGNKAALKLDLSSSMRKDSS